MRSDANSGLKSIVAGLAISEILSGSSESEIVDGCTDENKENESSYPKTPLDFILFVVATIGMSIAVPVLLSLWIWTIISIVAFMFTMPWYVVYGGAILLMVAGWALLRWVDE